MGLELGDTIDNKYRIVRLLGEGGMGAVYEGENTRIHRRVAIKILHSDVASSSDAVQRFEREAQAAGRIGSEHIVEVLDLGDLPGGDRYMVMEYLEGVALNDRISEAGKLSAQASASIVIDLLEGLGAAHDAGIIHRDLKPDNVFLLKSKGAKKDFVKIVDFGISKFNTLGEEFSMTRTGTVMGTPYYLSPEQAKGERNLDHRADLYAVGVILYESVVGNVPFDGESFNELLFKIVMDPLSPLLETLPDLDPDFAGIVEKSMARDPAQRYQTAVEMKGALEAWLAGRSMAPELAVEAPASRPGKTLETKSNYRTGAWANTQVGESAETSSNSKKVALMAALVLLFGAGGAFLAYNAKKDSEAAVLAAQEESDRARAEVEQERSEELARLQSEKARAEADRARAEQARSEAEKTRAEVQSSAAEREVARLAAEKVAAEKAAADKEAARLAANRRAARRRSANPASAAGSRTDPTRSGGRTIRTEF